MASQSETAYQKMRERILSAGVLPGEHLAEVEWAGRLGVGRFAIREGLRRLHGEGMVVKVRGKYRVTTMTAGDIREISRLRAVFEVGALRFAPTGIPDDLMSAIKSAADDYEDFVRRGYFEGAREADLRFHKALVAVSQNERLIRLYEASNLPLLQVKIGREPIPLDDFELAAAEHNKICEALKMGEIGRASQLLEDHLKRGELEVVGPDPVADAADRS